MLEYLIPIATYIIGIGVYLIEVTAECSVADDFTDVHINSREATTKDVWLALIWPILLLKLLLIGIVLIINELMVLVLLLVGFKYKNTYMYKNIHNLLLE